MYVTYSIIYLYIFQVEHSGNAANLFKDTIPSLDDFKLSEVELKEVQNRRFSQIYSLSIVGEN